ncbi:TlpA disulfide reductase family protein [Deinococcus aquiradiocola]|uniref:Alkyl hydroperoxide reductase n=1 Tax=Deinococcus aquiradiocola TaxID=393059 RepID=A0A917UPM2_9DEIO|nr:TlpA disulfide reductase family protein [Deinococcus aquiradiocola]GGJ72952.1 alkyl hydroperoxide reductase [Deinococcus aquiradiocola]
MSEAPTSPHHTDAGHDGRWPDRQDFVQGPPVPPPDAWERPGVVMFFNLECPGCVSRGLPFLKRLHAEFGREVQVMAVHTSRGHRGFAREDVEPQLRRFVTTFARLPFPVALDLTGSVAAAWETEGTPHTLVFAAGGELLRSVYGSQEGAQTRLEYLLAELSAHPS